MIKELYEVIVNASTNHAGLLYGFALASPMKHVQK